MSERDRYPHGVPCWIDTAQPDPEAAIAFYGSLLGWEFAGPGPMAGDPPGRYFVARVRGRDVAGISSPPPAGTSDPTNPAWVTHIAVESADDTAQLARAAGGTVHVDAFDAAPAGRLAVLSDRSGAVFCVWQAGERRGAQLVNEPSAWAMSALHTADPEGATAFYGALFGWEAEPFAPGVTLFRLPGYVGGEPQQPVPRDVVAAMMTTDGPSRWSVNLWVADAKQAAADTTRLGGEVRVAPHEIPGFRTAVLADPQGAELEVSQLLAPTGTPDGAQVG